MSIVALIDVDQNGPQCPRQRGRGKPGPPLVGGVRSPLLGAACRTAAIAVLAQHSLCHGVSLVLIDLYQYLALREGQTWFWKRSARRPWLTMKASNRCWGAGGIG
jgi:hypothetical protein